VRQTDVPIAFVIFAVASGSAGAETITTTTTTTVTIETTEPTVQPPSLTPVIAEARPCAAHVLMFSVALGPGLGLDTKDKCESGECVAAHVALGAAIGRHLVVLIGSSILTNPERPHIDLHHVESVGLRYLATSHVWGELGAGLGSKRSWAYSEPKPIDLDGVTPAFTIAVGYDPIVRDAYALGVEARLASAFDDIHHTSFVQLVAGLSWF
jgi:hypothetical protein